MSVRKRCSLKGIKPPTFYDHLRKVQDIFMDELQETQVSHAVIQNEPHLPA